MASTISAARAALFALLDANTYPGARPQVTHGAPDAYEEQEVVALLGFGPVDDEPAAIGQRRHEERFRIEVRVKAHDPGADTGASVESRCMALYDSVRTLAHANPTLSGTVTNSAPAGTDTSPGPQAAEGGGWVMFASCFVDCVARI